MKVFAVIAEFNPFHNGHAAVFSQARALGATHTTAVMSGNFVQRGEAAITEKRVRTHAALLGGADLIIELPLAYATATAQRFSQGAALLLQASGVVDALIFGSEGGDIAPLEEIASFLESDTLTDDLPFFLQQGMSFATARTKVIQRHLGREHAAIIKQPNNILGIEYLRAIKSLGWNIEAHTFPRAGTDHDSQTPSARYASASFLRRQQDLSTLAPYVPPAPLAVYQKAKKAGLYPADPSRFDYSILADLRRLTLVELKKLPQLSEGIERRLFHAIKTSTSLDELHHTMNTKRYTQARVRRLVLSAYLGITEQDATTPPPYLRILGFTKRGRELLHEMKTKATLPFGTRLQELETTSSAALRAAHLESSSTDLYTLLLPVVRPADYEQRTSGVYLK